MPNQNNRKPNYDPLVPSCYHDRKNLDIMAAKAHELYCSVEVKYSKLDSRPAHYSDKWEDIEPDIQRLSRNQIRMIPDQLERVGLYIDKIPENCDNIDPDFI